MKIDQNSDYLLIKRHVRGVIGRLYFLIRGRPQIAALIRGPSGLHGRDASPEVKKLHRRVRYLRRQVHAILRMLRDLKALTQSLFPVWAREKYGACPDHWLYEGYTAGSGLVWCRPGDRAKFPSPLNPECQDRLAKFPEHYKRCAWAAFCRAPWSFHRCKYQLPEELVPAEVIVIPRDRVGSRAYAHEDDDEDD